MLIGRGSGDFREKLAAQCDGRMSRLHATGELGGYDLSLHLSACDLMIQPYPDGITTRRSSATTAIAHRCPVVTTKGALTEPIWRYSDAVSLVPVYDADKFVSTVSRLLDDARERQRLSLAAAELYRESLPLPAHHKCSATRSAAGSTRRSGKEHLVNSSGIRILMYHQSCDALLHLFDNVHLTCPLVELARK